MKSVFLAVVFSATVAVATWFSPEAVLFAQEPTGFTASSVEVTELVKFHGDGSVFNTIKTSLAPILAGAIGIGLAVWLARFFFRIVKSMGR
jgi:hypothetical protein